jgi:hypothetical protein
MRKCRISIALFMFTTFMWRICGNFFFFVKRVISPETQKVTHVLTNVLSQVPVASPCPTCTREARTKVVARQADPLLQPPPAYQPSAPSTYTQHGLNTQQHFDPQGLLPPFIQTPGQFFNEQFATQQHAGPSSQQLLSPEVSHQHLPAIPQLGSPQLNHQLPPTAPQLTSLPFSHQSVPSIQQASELGQQIPSATPQLTSPHLNHQQTAVSPQLTYQQLSAAQQLSQQPISAAHNLGFPQLSQQPISESQLNNEQLPADQQLVSPLLNPKQQEVPHRNRRPQPSTTAPVTQEEVQLLYVPVEALHHQQQVITGNILFTSEGRSPCVV